MARPQYRIKRFVGKQTFADNARLTFDLPRDYDYESIIVRFYGTTTLTVAGTGVRAEAPLQIAKYIGIRANGTDLLDGNSGIVAHRMGAMRRGQLAPLTAQSDATVAARTFAGTVILDRCVIDGIRAKDGNFPTRGLSSFQLMFDAGAANDCFTGAPTGTITAGTVEIYVVQTVEQAGADGKYSLPRVVTKRTQATYAFAAANTNAQIRLNTGNLTRGLLLRSYGYVTAGEPSNAMLNNIKIQKGNQTLLDMSAAALRDLNAADMDITTMPTGFYFVDFMNMGGVAGKLSDCLDLRDGEETWLYLDTYGAANANVDVATMEYMPYNPKYWGIQG